MREICKDYSLFIPTLRLSITDKCYGKCSFCHREGLRACCSDTQMSTEMIEEQIIPAINSIGIKKVILTGGEPTLHPELAYIARSLRDSCPGVQIGITTNGYNTTVLREAAPYFDKITISVSSYKPSVYMGYTCINPSELIKTVNGLQMKSKAASIVITEDNYDEIGSLVMDLLKQGYEVKLQFIIGNGSIDDSRKYKLFHLLCSKLGRYDIRIETTPVICWKGDKMTTLRFKLATLNRFIYDNLAHRKACMSCSSKNECIERGCAIRVYPNGTVSPCLDNRIVYGSGEIKTRLENAYADMEVLQ